MNHHAAEQMTPLQVALMNALSAYELSIRTFRQAKDRAGVRKQCELIRAHAKELAAQPSAQAPTLDDVIAAVHETGASVSLELVPTAAPSLGESA